MRWLLVMVVAACNGAITPPPAPLGAPPPVALGAPLAIPGEGMVFAVGFRGLEVGRVQVAVGRAGWVETRPAIIVRSRGETSGLLALIGELTWEMATTIDLEDGTPLRVVEDSHLVFRGKPEDHHRDRTTPEAHSIHSAATGLRGWRSTVGQRVRFEMRIDAAHLDVDLRDAGRELLASAGKPAVRYEGVARSKFPFKLWISDDAARVPLLLRASTKWGAVTVELIEYVAPRD